MLRIQRPANYSISCYISDDTEKKNVSVFEKVILKYSFSFSKT